MTMFPRGSATDPTYWYKTVKGILDSDYYALYPFEKDDHLTIGFSKYGEFIDPNTGTGLNYSGRDPFANEGVDKICWLNGWFLTLATCIEAMALDTYGLSPCSPIW